MVLKALIALEVRGKCNCLVHRPGVGGEISMETVSQGRVNFMSTLKVHYGRVKYISLFFCAFLYHLCE